MIGAIYQIDTNYGRPIILEELASCIGVTPQYLCLIFKKCTSTRIFEYINFIRIQKSKVFLLQNKEMSINEIAGLCGYSDTSYFCWIFRKIEGISPNQFKGLHMYEG